jgi:hypothetical protein
MIAVVICVPEYIAAIRTCEILRVWFQYIWKIYLVGANNLVIRVFSAFSN